MTINPKYYKILSFVCVLVWCLLVAFTICDNLGFISKDVGVFETLKQSVFARGMFVDIGILSTIIAAWMVFGTKLKSRFIFALFTIFVGSFAVLPFLALYFYSMYKEDLD